METKPVWTIIKILNWTKQYFADKGVENPRLDAEILLCAVLKCERIKLYLDFERPLDEQELAQYRNYVARRAKHEPLAYILGEKAFMRNIFKVSSDTLVPRPETELLVESLVMASEKINPAPKILDIGTGSGAIIVSLLDYLPQAKGVGVDISSGALVTAKENALQIGVADRAAFLLSDLFSAVPENKKFDIIVSNPPYSVNWIGSDDPTLINDDRFAPAGVLAPKSKADFAFVLHSLSYLSSRGRAAIVCFPGIFYRGGAEQKIRKYLVDSNFIETIISLPSNLFYGTSIAVNILVLSKHKPDTKIQFIDASGESFFTKETNNNVLENKHIDRIIDFFDKKEDVDYIAKSVDYKSITENDYNLSVSSYIEVKDTRPKTDIKELNERIRRIVERENELRIEIDKIVAELEEDEL